MQWMKVGVDMGGEESLGKPKKRDEERHIMQISGRSLPFQNSGNQITKSGGFFYLFFANSFSLCICLLTQLQYYVSVCDF